MKSLLFIAMLTINSISWGQTDSTRQVAVRATIDRLFEGMRLGDSSMVRSVFHTDARGYTSYIADDIFKLHNGSIDEFVAAVGSPHDNIWDERISNVVIQIDDGIAQAWMEY